MATLLCPEDIAEIPQEKKLIYRYGHYGKRNLQEGLLWLLSLLCVLNFVFNYPDWIKAGLSLLFIPGIIDWLFGSITLSIVSGTLRVDHKPIGEEKTLNTNQIVRFSFRLRPGPGLWGCRRYLQLLAEKSDGSSVCLIDDVPSIEHALFLRDRLHNFLRLSR